MTPLDPSLPQLHTNQCSPKFKDKNGYAENSNMPQ